MVNPETLKKEIELELKRIDLEIFEKELENEKVVNDLEEVLIELEKNFSKENIDEFISSYDSNEESLSSYLTKLGYLIYNVFYIEKEVEGLVESKEKINEALKN